jgi:DNA-binding NtrC family response regulator
MALRAALPFWTSIAPNQQHHIRRRFMLLTQLLVDDIRGLRRDDAGAARTSDAMRMIRLAERAAKAAMPVLIEGEPGTGADALARAIHDCSDRKGRPFLRVHADGLARDPNLVLFGTEGAGAQRGRVLEAHGGTLLIQNVEDLPAEAQGGLLRLIQDGEVQPLGGKRAVRADVRVIATTAANLIERVRQGRFREDLYYRLHVLPIGLQPLRARREEIAHFAKLFAARFAAEEGKRVAGLSPDAEALLVRYDWPGNLCQLENAVFRAVILAEGPELTSAEFPQIAARQGLGVEIPPLPVRAALAPLREVVRVEVRDPHALALMDDHGEMRTLEELEAEIIRFALAHYRGHMSAVSRRLGIGRSTLYRKLKDLGLENEMADAAA